MPKLVRIACIVAFAMAGLTILSALTGPLLTLPLALVPLAAGIGILNRRIWSAYGLALFLFMELLQLPFFLLRTGSSHEFYSDLLFSAALVVVLILLFVFAGRSLAVAGGKRGRVILWVAISVLFNSPLLFFQAFMIPTAAMEPTLLVGDRILALRNHAPPKNGDLLVLVYPIDRHQTFVKRVVGTPGDRIKIAGKVVYRNGIPLNEPYAIHETNFVDSYRDNFPSEPTSLLPTQAQDMLTHHVVNGEVVVPAGKYFVLGDNRDNSLDSRYWGFVGDGDLIGRPVLIYESEEQPNALLPSGKFTVSRGIRWERFFKAL